MSNLATDKNDSINEIAFDYFMMLELHENGELDEEFNIVDASKVFTRLKKAEEKRNSPEFQILVSHLEKRIINKSQ